MATYWENSCSFGLRYVSWCKYLIASLVFSHLGFWSGNLFLIAPFPDLCLLVPSLTWSDTEEPVQSQKWARNLKFLNKEEEILYYLCSENKDADQLCSYFVIAFAFVFCWFSFATAHVIWTNYGLCYWDFCPFSSNIRAKGIRRS